MALHCWIIACFAVIAAIVHYGESQLHPNFYDGTCPLALPTIRFVVDEAIALEPRIGASILRLHFHDCFVNGCDGSILLDDRPGFTGEKTALPNINSVRGFEVIDQIKDAVNSVCFGNVISCADILAVAARDSVAALGGPSYQVLLGRKDSRTASKDAANNGIPPPFSNLTGLIASFRSHGLNLNDLVVLSGAHTIGLARCTTFKSRIYNDTNIDPIFARSLRALCPLSGGDDNRTVPLDETTPAHFDTLHYIDLLQERGLLHSDQELYKGDGSASDSLVSYYSNNLGAFWADFGDSMVKMGNLKPPKGTKGEIRWNCRKVN